MWLLRLAATARRVLLLKTEHPCHMEDLLEPGLLDWRVGDLQLPPKVVATFRLQTAFSCSLELPRPQLRLQTDKNDHSDIWAQLVQDGSVFKMKDKALCALLHAAACTQSLSAIVIECCVLCAL